MAFIYGINPVKEALYAQRRKIEKILVVPGRDKKLSGRQKEIIETALKQGITLDFAELKQMSSMLGTTEHQGVMAFIQEKEFIALSHLVDRTLSQNRNGMLLILDGLEDPRNLGSIIRSGVAFGIEGIIMAKDRAVHITPVVAKAAAGALEYVNLCQVTNICQTIVALKEKGLWVWGLDAAGAERIDKVDLEGPLALVIGAEGRGLRHLVKIRCDGILRIPMRGRISSFNASVACSLALYELRRKKTWLDG